MKRSLIVVSLVLMSAAALFAGGQSEAQPIQAEPAPIEAEALNTSNPAVINIVETYPDENIYNAIGRNTVKSGQPEAIFTVFDELRRTYDPIIVNWEFLPLGGSLSADTTTEGSVGISQELISYAKEHIALDERYELLETYDSTTASIIIVVEAEQNTSLITPKVTLTSISFNYKLITPTDQIVIGRSSASIVKETFYDKATMRIGEKVLVDVWY
ncbi:MAG: hypothetical protein PQJ59_16280 [Spirochaetales bacterium]|nr:hypothetical protein [Spirochaetales bacterium]